MGFVRSQFDRKAFSNFIEWPCKILCKRACKKKKISKRISQMQCSALDCQIQQILTKTNFPEVQEDLCINVNLYSSHISRPLTRLLVIFSRNIRSKMHQKVFGCVFVQICISQNIYGVFNMLMFSQYFEQKIENLENFVKFEIF